MDWTEAKPSKLLCKALTPWCILHVQLGMVTVIWTHEVITPGNSGLFCCACFPWSISNHAGTCLAHAGVCLEAVYTAQLGALPAPAGLAGLAAPQHLPQGSLCCWSCVSCLGSAPELAAGLCSCRLWSCCSASQQDRLIAASPAAAPAHLLSVRTWVQLGTGTATPGYSRAVDTTLMGSKGWKRKNSTADTGCVAQCPAGQCWAVVVMNTAPKSTRGTCSAPLSGAWHEHWQPQQGFQGFLLPNLPSFRSYLQFISC